MKRILRKNPSSDSRLIGKTASSKKVIFIFLSFNCVPIYVLFLFIWKTGLVNICNSPLHHSSWNYILYFIPTVHDWVWVSAIKIITVMCGERTSWSLCKTILLPSSVVGSLSGNRPGKSLMWWYRTLYDVPSSWECKCFPRGWYSESAYLIHIYQYLPVKKYYFFFYTRLSIWLLLLLFLLLILL